MKGIIISDIKPKVSAENKADTVTDTNQRENLVCSKKKKIRENIVHACVLN